MTVFSIILSIAIMAFWIWLAVDFDNWFENIGMGLACEFFLFVVVFLIVGKYGYNTFEEKYYTGTMIPYDNDSSVYLKLSNLYGYDSYSFMTSEGEKEMEYTRCEIQLLGEEDTIAPYCELYGGSLRNWAKIFFRDNGFMAKTENTRIYIKESMIRDERSNVLEVYPY